MTREPRWRRCVTHADQEVSDFLASYFAAEDRVCLLVAGAGFDPRSAFIARALAATKLNGERFRALFIREHRPNPDPELARRGDESATAIAALVPIAESVDVDVFSFEDKAVVGGHRAIEVLRRAAPNLLDGATDVVLDMSALSIGISFPIALFLYEACRNGAHPLNFHVMAATNSQLDDAISSEPSDVVDPIRGFSGEIDLAESGEDPKVWLPHLAVGRNFALQRIRDKLEGPVDICPVLPISQRDPKSADRLLAAFQPELEGTWDVDPRNYVYAIEDDPLDLYRTITTLHRRYTAVLSEIAKGHVVLSPSGNKVLAIGALMAAMEHALPVRYVEALSYKVDWDKVAGIDLDQRRLVHVWLHGDPYAPATLVPDDGGSSEKGTAF